MKSFLYSFLILFSSLSYGSEWNWDQIDHKKMAMDFPQTFLWGTATAEYQNSGADTCYNNNWAEWEESQDKNGIPRIKDGQRSNKSTDHWRLFKEDINLMKELGVNAYRFSVEWSLIEPREGVFDLEAIKHYEKEIDALLAAKITPLITLHHFTNPMWFQKKGSFEKEENIEYFVRFCSFVFEKLSSKVDLWCTINEPGIYTMQGYIRGEFPPGETNLQKASEVLKNLLKAHCAVYKKLKSMPNGKKAQIGLVHNLLKFESYSSWNPLTTIPASYLTYMNHDVIIKFLKTGVYEFYIPLTAYSYFVEERDSPILDFIGLNYYSHPLLGMQISLSNPIDSCCYEGEIMSDVKFRLYPEGIYRAVEEMSELGVPIYITENGIPDKSGLYLGEFINKYLFALSKAIKDGYDVRGYFYWTLVDNFEWNHGFNIRWGLYKNDLSTQQRTLKEGAKNYQSIVNSWRSFHNRPNK